MATPRPVARERSQEMLEKPALRDTFFSLKNAGRRPVSVATEFMETDWEMEEEEEVHSEFEEDCENSPRGSLHSSGQPSITTLSSYEEVHTPTSGQNRTVFPYDVDPAKPVEGPRGPHLFRSSVLSAHSIEFQNALSLSPITPKAKDPGFPFPITLDLGIPKVKRQSGPFRFTDEQLDTADLSDWSPEKVAQWMLNAGIELSAAERFVENDINGAILITLKFEDLRELGIPSFGVRTKVWEEIHVMRNIRPTEPVPETDIEDAPSREVKKELRKLNGDPKPKRKASKRSKLSADDIISPLESVSIVGIEQMMPKPHHCSKGENCPKWKRNQRMIEAFKKDHPFVDMDGGVIMVAGDPGNPATAEAINKTTDDFFRPVSDAIPSIVASSDVMGPGGLPPLQYLQEATLRNVQARDPQDNVRQFLSFQHTQVGSSSEVPPTPPFEIFPAQQAPHQGLRSLPKLSIPSQAPRNAPYPMSAHPFITEVVEDDDSASETTPTAVYRFGTPFSDMDVPVTAVPLGPVARDFSQSVPPDMNYRHVPNPPSRTLSRASARRPSFPVLPALDENMVTAVETRPSLPPAAQRAPPPRVQYPWSKPNPTYERAIPPVPGSSSAASGGAAMSHLTPVGAQPKDASDPGISYQGPMKKRKTKMLRHEWHDRYFTLRGTRLNMHKEATQTHRTLEYIDIDDYAIACSGLASGKLNAAFKAMSIRRGAEKDGDVAAFSFQLIPQDGKGGARLRKRESAVPASASSANASSTSLPAPEGAVNGTGKTHHFAVKGRDERIDWMRELMLAKALKQKGEGFEVSVNGNMI